MNAPLKLLEDKSNISTDEFTRTVVEPSKPLRELLETTTEKHVEHYQIDVKNDVDKMKSLHELLESNVNAVIFCNGISSLFVVRHACAALKLKASQYDVCSMDGDLLPRKRDILVDQLRSGEFKHLVTTDIKPSKLRDSLVVMYDIPSCLKFYKDRDRPSAVSLVKPSDEIRMKRIKKGT
ncbi:hypothetical protein F2Q68_00001231 [Brassica cretica]|uniref:Helicase C-terminal domain-containing protein n=2 Tax=Brassica cretica TaxID=69181 RepID=A0ABQ7C1Q2_BRACR|nr:hypothetical protein F2Q68_00001231 [Brassica cretica]KAF3545572.1 hypothetical protein DY000_02001644 [Brassica cretica]